MPRQPTSFVVALVTRTYVQYAYWRKRVLLICFGFAILQWRRGVPNPTFTRAVPPNTPFATWLMSQLLHLIATEGWAGPLLPSFVSKLWAIWLTRKTQVFRQERATIKKLQHHIQLDQHQHSSFSVKPSTLLAGKCCVSPPPGFHYAHFGRLRQTPPMATFQLFGTWDKRYMKVGVAWIVDVHDDTPTLGTGQQIFASSKLHTILQSCILALFWAQSRLLSHIVVHSDSTSLIRLSHTNSSSDFNTRNTLATLRTLLDNFDGCSIHQVHKSQLQEAAHLARTYNSGSPFSRLTCRYPRSLSPFPICSFGFLVFLSLCVIMHCTLSCCQKKYFMI